uniref:Retrovirus-related Pol polyprotein from transposon TNT 1-94 n=1 Tax=Tanacetum cinerariifolium TaxID=118510 RepID=A0A6L2MA32_TANCI|nr:retrovirus-related Pol polyprotein from transposon TNT 1-94 [Tanacetum cinerariifolium]
MSTQQDIYVAGSENHPHMLNKENYVPWSSRLLRYAKSRPNRKLIYNSIMSGPYVRRMIPEPADDQAIQTIVLGLHEDIYAAVDSFKTAQEIWLRVQQMMKGSDIGIQEKKANTECQESGCSECSSESVHSECWKSEWAFVVLRIANQNSNRNGNDVAARAEGNAIGNNSNQIRCYNYRGLGVDNTAKTRRPQPRSNTKNDRVPSASNSNCNKNKEVEVEEHPRNLLLSKNKKHMLSEFNNVKLAIQNDRSEVVCAMCKQFLITANHDVCVLNYVNDMNSCGKKQKANVSNTKNQKKQKPKVMKPKKIGSNERLASPKPSKPRSCLSWSPTGRLLDLKGKIITSSESEKATRTMLIFSRTPLFIWAEAIATACYIQNRSIIHRRFNKTPYELINDIKPDISFLHVFGALCYPKNDREDSGKLGAKGDIGFFIGYYADSFAYRVYN